MMKTFLVILFAAIFSLPPSFAEEAHPWPRIQTLSKEWRIEGTAITDEKTSAITYIKALDGTPVYKVECHNGNYGDQSEINFSGDFQCALFSVKDGRLTSGNLLASNTKNELSADWWNRGRMRSEQLRGKCLKYAEYSTIRHFKLRGMLITLSFSDVKWTSRERSNDGPLLNGYTVAVAVIPDSSANSSKAEPIKGPVPPKSCYP